MKARRNFIKREYVFGKSPSGKTPNDTHERDGFNASDGNGMENRIRRTANKTVEFDRERT
ncbi:MAG: hypothetical protein ACLUE6_06265 [Acutalibacteraceae bacterium]